MSRRKKLLADLEQAKKDFTGKETSYIKEVKLEDESVTFTFFTKKGGDIAYSLYLSEYPETCMLYAPSKDPEMVAGNINDIISQLIEANCKKLGIEVSNVKLTKPAEEPQKKSKDNMDTDESAESDDTDVDGRSQLSDSKGWRNASTGSQGFEDEEADENRYKENAKLVLDLDNFKSIFGEDSLQCKPMPVLETVDVEMKFLITEFLDGGAAEAWKVDPSLPIILRMPFSDLYYVETSKPTTAEFFQIRNGFEKVKFGLAYQLTSTLNSFIKKNWPGFLEKKYVVKRYVKPQRKEVKPGAETQTKNNPGFLERMLGSSNKKAKKKI